MTPPTTRKDDDPPRIFPDTEGEDADVLSALLAFVRRNAVAPSEFEGDGRIVPLSALRAWIWEARRRRLSLAHRTPRRRER